ncbi:Nuclear receptor-binding factor 2 [Halotydeus destructor]|nr:Nuclear receptor-binding factor 2 [Halotydeus destructor]
MSFLDFDHDTPLNKAHRYARQAVDNEKSFKFELALTSHSKAIDYLKQALELSTHEKARESLQAQIAFHEKQSKLVNQRRECFKKKAEEYYRRKGEAQKKKDSLIDANQENPVNPSNEHETNQIYLESEIYRVIEQHDSLLDFLSRDKNSDSSISSQSVTASYKTGSKMAKSDKMVIEELKINNEQLRALVQQLVSELDKLQKENHQLKVEVISSNQANEQPHFVFNLPELHPLEPPKLLY